MKMQLWWLRCSGAVRNQEELIHAADAVEAEAVGRAWIDLQGLEGARIAFVSVRPAVIAGPETVTLASARRPTDEDEA